jgi:hypothetical protein
MFSKLRFMDVIVSTEKCSKYGIISKGDIYMLVVKLTCYLFFKINYYTRHFGTLCFPGVVVWNPCLPSTKITDVVSERTEANL